MHPFERIYRPALSASHIGDNRVLSESKKLREIGYSSEEILGVLRRLKAGLISESEEKIVAEAIEEFSRDFN